MPNLSNSNEVNAEGDIFNETDQIRDKCLQDLKQWLSEVSLNARTEDKYLLPFVRGCKFNLSKIQRKITNYYIMKRDRPEWFSNRNPLLPNLQDLIKLGVFVPLKKYHDNKMVIVIRTAAHDPKRHTWDDLSKAGMMILDVACMENEVAQTNGVIAIFDMFGMGFSHYRTLTPTLIKNIVFAWQNYHVRPKQLEFINSPIYINVALNIFKSFMTEKMKGRVKVHFGGVEKAHTIVDKEILPFEYGGNEGSFESLGNFWFEKLLEYKDWFRDDERYKAS
ncbi:hypothetical protein ABEB36_010324 [Hypothenemus hampei]|uniref:CRAL-TRIO domain-containing protein n=1 Tax=Hypothenemus hampei TaxID=57062 RepID=A0ABD1EJA2_HYPHA